MINDLLIWKGRTLVTGRKYIFMLLRKLRVCAAAGSTVRIL